MDMMLQLIADRHGGDLAKGVANQFQHERIRDEREDQRGGRLDVLSRMPEKVQRAIGIMQRNIENPLSLPDIAKRVGMSPRQLERSCWGTPVSRRFACICSCGSSGRASYSLPPISR